MEKRVIRCVTAGLVLGLLWLGACSSSGSSTIDLNGTFLWKVTINQTTCGDPDVRTADVRIAQDGNSVTIYLPVTGSASDAPIGAALDGSHLQGRGTFSDPPWSLILDIAATVGGNGESLQGTMDFAWVNSKTRETCAEHGPFTATKL